MRTGLSAKISIIGAGAWGTAIARVIADKGYDVDIWCYEKEIADDINTNHTNSKYLIGVTLPPKLHALVELDEAVDSKDFILLA